MIQKNISTQTNPEVKLKKSRGKKGSILDLFDKVQITNTERIEPEDKTFCQNLEKEYVEAITFLTNTINQFQEITGIDLMSKNYYRVETKNTFLYSYNLKELADLVKDTKDAFINKIISYFNKKHNVKILSETIKDKYELNVRYIDIVDEIFIQLGGFSFKEKAVIELKEKMKESVRIAYDNRINVEVKGAKIILPNYAYIDSWHLRWNKTHRLHYSSVDKLLILLTAISHFEQNVTENAYNGVINKLRDTYDNDLFKEHALMCIKAESIRPYKNGKVEIMFLSKELATLFAKEYCGYV
jgi:hypothetical protein